MRQLPPEKNVFPLLHAHPMLWFFAFLANVLCVMTLYFIAEARGQSRWHCVWGTLGIPGLVVALLIMLALPAGRPVPGSQ
jgi:hypothetical protein